MAKLCAVVNIGYAVVVSAVFGVSGAMGGHATLNAIAVGLLGACCVWNVAQCLCMVLQAILPRYSSIEEHVAAVEQQTTVLRWVLGIAAVVAIVAVHVALKYGAL